MRFMLRHAHRGAAPGLPCDGAIDKIEAALHAGAPDAGAYTDGYLRLAEAIGRPTGPFPDDFYALHVHHGRMAAEEAVGRALAEAAAPEPTPRDLMLRLFVAALVAEPGYAASRGRALEDGRQVEASCYNATVLISKQSAVRRAWDNPAFVNIYSARCGAVLGLLDPTSAPCRAYGADLGRRLFAGELSPAAVGGARERDLCAAATAAEVAEIANRSAQTVKLKSSTLFRCPFCKKNECTYQEVQLRGADEEPDYRCICSNPECGKRFKGRT